MGWSVDSSDPRCLWRDNAGVPITWSLANGDEVTLCTHPWRDGVNLATDVSFSPAHNYHRNVVDWRRIVVNASANQHGDC